METKYSEKMIDNVVDFTGKLNNHENYLKMLDILEKKCSFIGISKNHKIIDIFNNFIISIEKSYTWWGIETSYLETLYYIKTSKELFNFLRKYDTFCKYIIGSFEMMKSDEVVLTEFGQNDIAFFDDNEKILLRTNTHEGFIFVNKNIDELFNN